MTDPHIIPYIDSQIQKLASFKAQAELLLADIFQIHSILQDLRTLYQKDHKLFSEKQIAELKNYSAWLTEIASQHCVEMIRQEQKLSTEIADLESQKDSLRELIKQALQHDHVGQMQVENIQVILKENESVVVPSKGSGARAALEDLLRTNGVWEQVTSLSSTRLNQFRSHGMPPELRAQIEAKFGVQQKPILVIKTMRDG